MQKIQTITVRLAYEDPIRAIEFLEQAFGFSEIKQKRLEGPKQSIIVAELSIGDAYIMVGPAGAHNIKSPSTTGASTQSLMVYVTAIDAHFERAKQHGALIISEPSDMYWGDRSYEARDHEGHLWFFHERTRQVPQDEIDKIEAEFRQ